MSTLYETLRSIPADRIELDELVFYRTIGNGMILSYKALNIPAPAWLSGTMSTVNLEIQQRVLEARKKRLADIEIGLESTMTREEKRERLLEEQAEIRALLSE